MCPSRKTRHGPGCGTLGTGREQLITEADSQVQQMREPAGTLPTASSTQRQHAAAAARSRFQKVVDAATIIPSTDSGVSARPCPADRATPPAGACASGRQGDGNGQRCGCRRPSTRRADAVAVPVSAATACTSRSSPGCAPIGANDGAEFLSPQLKVIRHHPIPLRQQATGCRIRTFVQQCRVKDTKPAPLASFVAAHDACRTG